MWFSHKGVSVFCFASLMFYCPLDLVEDLQKKSRSYNQCRAGTIYLWFGLVATCQQKGQKVAATKTDMVRPL